MTMPRCIRTLAARIAPYALGFGLLISAGPARGQEIYWALLTPGGSEVVDDSLGFGVATLGIADEVVFYSVWLHNVPRVTAVRVRAEPGLGASAGIVKLYEGPGTASVNGRLAAGWFRANAVRGMTWNEFLLALEGERVSVQVVLRDSPRRELTGQMRPLDAPPDSLLPPQLARSGSR
jgi:hypothetical protein